MIIFYCKAVRNFGEGEIIKRLNYIYTHLGITKLIATQRNRQERTRQAERQAENEASENLGQPLSNQVVPIKSFKEQRLPPNPAQFVFPQNQSQLPRVSSNLVKGESKQSRRPLAIEPEGQAVNPNEVASEPEITQYDKNQRVINSILKNSKDPINKLLKNKTLTNKNRTTLQTYLNPRAPEGLLNKNQKEKINILKRRQNDYQCTIFLTLLPISKKKKKKSKKQVEIANQQAVTNQQPM